MTNASDASEDLRLWREAVREEGLRLGFSLVRFTDARELDDTRQRRWQRWQEQDLAGKMDYLRRRSPRRTHPRDLLPQAESLIMVAAAYYDGDHEAAAADSLVGKIARYGWGEDYHFVMKARLSELARWIESNAPQRGYTDPIQWRAFTDSAPIDERAFAERAGLGFIGKNTLLLHPEHGSWMLLGELLISIPFAPDEPITGSCGACRKCLEACPTEAFIGPYQLDPRRCISYLTIEQPDPISPELAKNMQSWAFGCDICQEVCPLNERPMPRLMPELAGSRGAGPSMSESQLNEYPSNKSFARRWKRTPLTRAGLKGMKKNFAALQAAESPDATGKPETSHPA